MNPTAERALALDDSIIGTPIKAALAQLCPEDAAIDLGAGARHLLTIRRASLRYADLRVMPVDLGGERPPDRRLPHRLSRQRRQNCPATTLRQSAKQPNGK